MASSKKRKGGLVWDSEVGATCPGCGQPVASCACRAAAENLDGDGIVRVRLEKKGRGGKTVTVITGIPLPPSEIAALAKDLKKRCGAGGKVAGNEIEIQGDRRDAILADLQRRGFQAKRGGG